MNKNRPPEFVTMYDYVHALSEKLGVMDRIAQRVAKEHAGKLYTTSGWYIGITLLVCHVLY